MWQLMEDVKGMWYTEWIRGIEHGDYCKVCRVIKDWG